MPAIDFGTGFINGLNTADRISRGRRAQDLQERSLDEATEHRDRRYALELEGAQATEDYRRKDLEIKQKNADSSAADRRSTRAIQMKNANTSASKEAREAKGEQTSALKERAAAEMQRVLTGAEPDLNLAGELKSNKLNHLSVPYWLDDQNVKDNIALRGILQKVGQGDFSQVNTPESLALIENVYADQLNVGAGELSASSGKAIRKKSLDGLHSAPGGQGIVATLKVMYQDGTTDVKPITLNRSSSPDDQVAINDLGTMLDDVQGRVQLAEVFSRDDVRQQLQGARASLFAADDAKSQTPQMKNIKYLQAQGMDFDEARDLVMMAKTNPIQATNNLAGKILESQAFLPPGQKLSPEEAFNEARRIIGVETPQEDAQLPPQEQYLKENPHLADQYKAKYGTLPGWFKQGQK